MGALPKNKITRAERGKRRAGNTPDLKKDPKVHSVPLHKRGLVNSILAATGLKKVESQPEESKPKQKNTSKTVQPNPSNTEPAQIKANQASVSAGRKTQHKG